MLRRRAAGIARFALVAGIAAAALLPASLAQRLGSFAAADADHDGKVTFAEFAAYETQRLRRIDGPRARHFLAEPAARQAAPLHVEFDRLDVGRRNILRRTDWTGG